MKFHVLYVSSVSACFELENAAPYYAEECYDVSLNGSPALLGVRTNVFSLFDLQPGTEYTVAVGEAFITFKTKRETACLNVRDFGAKGDGIADDTCAIQNAIHVCPRDGRVRVPAGIYVVGPLVLKSHMTLELCEGARLLGDTCEEHYPLFPGEIHDDITFRSAPGRAIPSRAARASSAPTMPRTLPLWAGVSSTAMHKIPPGGRM